MQTEILKHTLPSKIVYGFEQLSQIIRSLYWDKLKSAGLSPIQFQMIRFMTENENHKITIGTLAAKFALSYATISDSIKILVDKGIVFKKQDQRDKRIFYVEITPKGKFLLAELTNWDEKLVNSLSEFDHQFLTTLNSGILQLLESFETKNLINKTRLCLTCKYFRKDSSGIESDHHQCVLFNLTLHQSDLRIDCDQHEEILVGQPVLNGNHNGHHG